MGSPLGKYSDLVAAVTAVSIVGVYLIVLLLQAIGLSAGDVSNLKDFAFIAVGAVFTLGGKVAGANGTKAVAEAAHERLDAIGAPSTQQAEKLNGPA